MEATALSIGKSVLSGALGYAKSSVAEEVALQLGITRDQAFVRDELEMMLSFLMAAHDERDKNMVVETCVKQIRVVAYDVEDSLMDFAVRVEKQSWWLPWRIPRNLLDRRHVAKQMKDLRTKVEDVSQRSMRYRLIEGGSSSKTAPSVGDTAATAAAMFGIDETMYAAKTKGQPRPDLTQLINDQEREDLVVVALWGTSGSVGHTSIIWEAYENAATQKNFPCRAWVRLMHPFIPKDFIRSILEEFRPASKIDFLMEEEKTGQALVEEFHSYVSDKKCLIVLDNLSTIQEWNRVKKCFPDNKKKGHTVIVSTTNVEVASLCVGQNSVVSSELKQLSVDQTIYAFYVEPIARQSVQTSTVHDSSQRAGQDGNTRTRIKNSQDVTNSEESVSSSTLPTSEIQEDQSEDADGNMTAGTVEKSQVAGREGEKESENANGNMTAGAVEKSQVTGREGEKEFIAKQILEHSDNHLEVIAVWGMGGIGKTTLVTDVYQRQDINDKFTKHAFVTILRPFKLQELLRSIAIQLDVESSGNKGAKDFVGDKKKDYASMSVEDLTDTLDRLSNNRKCLIVVDDLLYTPEWDKIIMEFRKIKKAKSWTIAITTRQKNIAEHCCKKPECIYMLNTLGAEEARELFIKTVFKEPIDLDKKYPELVEPAKLILNKCDGLPLAIVTIGSFLAEQETKTVVEWRKLNAHIAFEMEMNPKIERIRVVLMKSYDGLPYYLKPCFLYMSIFPEDHIISRRRLVCRWAIEGYSAEARDKSCMETADDYFKKLIERSMILPTCQSIWSRQNTDSCRLHDLIRDISISMSRKENLVFRLEEGWSSSNISHDTVRHLAISSNWNGDKSEFESIVELSRIRSLTVFGKWKPFYISDKMRFLRVLDLEGTDGIDNHCLVHIGKLVHLRYLSLRGCRRIFCLPDSMGNLSQLEVLDIKNTPIQVLPKSIVRLRKLRYIHSGDVRDYMFGRPRLSYLDKCRVLLGVPCAPCLGMSKEVDYYITGVTGPRGMRKLKSLHTLRHVHLAWGNAVVEEIKGLTGLRKLGVVGINGKNIQNLCLAISKLSHLESLSLCSKLDLPSDCLDAVKPPPENLQSLKLIGCRMDKLPEWIKGLQNLVKLNLRGTGLSRDCPDMLMQDIGKLPNLLILRLLDWWCDVDIGEVQFKCGLFSRLKVLALSNYSSPKIESIKFEQGAMPKLEVLYLGILQDVRYSGLEYLHSIKEVRAYHVPKGYRKAFYWDISEQLDKNKKGHVFKLEARKLH